MGGGMEIITGVERRRRWRLEDKLDTSRNPDVDWREG